MRKTLYVDFETFSTVDLRKVGSFRYAMDPTTEPILLGWCLHPGPRVRVWDCLDQPTPPAELLAAAADNSVVFAAHNAMFDWAVWQYSLRRLWPEFPSIPIGRVLCTSSTAAVFAFPRGLENLAIALDTGAQKDKNGDRLKRLFTRPRKPTKHDARTRVWPHQAPLDWRAFKGYCGTDIRTMIECHQAFPPLPHGEIDTYRLDLQINARGLPIDIPTVRKAYTITTKLEANIAAKVTAIAGGIRPTQRDKMMGFMKDMGADMENLQAETIRTMLLSAEDMDPKLRELLQLRLEASRASTKKLIVMQGIADLDGRARGMFLYYGAHTGRWSGRYIQPQNFIRGNLKQAQIDVVFDMLQWADADAFELLYQRPMDTISQCMRGFIKAPDGYVFHIVDYTAIEARVLAWLANEAGMLKAYFEGLDVYKVMASRLFSIAYEDVDGEQRRIAKNLVLGCGYSLGGKKFVEYCARAGVVITEAFAIAAVRLYRQENQAIVRFWYDVEAAAARAIATQKPVQLRNLWFDTLVMGELSWLRIGLPSGRQLYYPWPMVTQTEHYGKLRNQISFKADFRGRMLRGSTYGGRLVENIVQAVSRDIMVEGMNTAEEYGYAAVGTVHDELITLCPKSGEHTLKELEKLISRNPVWASGLPLGCEGFTCVRYRKG